MRIAIVHEWLATYAGSERVVEQMLHLYPNADLFALVDSLDRPEIALALDTGHAHIAREESPGPVPANIVVAAGTSSVADLIAGVEDGLFIERFWYFSDASTKPVSRERTDCTAAS